MPIRNLAVDLEFLQATKSDIRLVKDSSFFRILGLYLDGQERVTTLCGLCGLICPCGTVHIRMMKC